MGDAQIQGTLDHHPAGVILHGSDSGIAHSLEDEFTSTVRYAVEDHAGPDFLGWNATIGRGKLAIHYGPAYWGWNAREHSPGYVAVEFAHALVDDPVPDDMVETFCWYFIHEARAVWPDLPLYLPMHSELPAGIRDGKVDVYPRGDARCGELRNRIIARLAAAGVT